MAFKRYIRCTTDFTVCLPVTEDLINIVRLNTGLNIPTYIDKCIPTRVAEVNRNQVSVRGDIQKGNFYFRAYYLGLGKWELKGWGT